jgi:hypothetical protein
MKIEVGTMLNAKIDIGKWREVAAKRFPEGVPERYSDDVTQRIGSRRLAQLYDALDGDVIRAGSFAPVKELVHDIKAYLAARNANPKPYKWKAEGTKILSKIKRARVALDKAEAA